MLEKLGVPDLSTLQWTCSRSLPATCCTASQRP